MSSQAFACLVAAAVQAPPAASTPSDIIVTGERVRRAVRETASSVIVITRAEIEASGADRVDQLLAMIPNVQLGNGSSGPAIRGMDTTGPLYALPAFLGGNRPRTTMIVDGRSVTYNEFVFGAFPAWDVERVEVFRSPQTTTQGQNSIAGAIFVNTADPEFHPEYRARAILGDFRTRQLSALASGPVAGDEVAFRISGDLRYSRTTSRIADDIEDGNPNHDAYGLLRAKLLIKPGPDTRASLTYVHTQSQSPQTVGVVAPFRERRDDSPGYGVFRINVDSLTAAARHSATDALAADLVLTVGDSSARRLAIRDFGQTSSHGRDWSGELVLNWSPQGPLRIVGGASHRHARLDQRINLRLLSGSTGRFRDRQDGSGIFADARVALSSRATLTAGIRYQRDRQRREGALTADTFAIPVDFAGKFDAWLPKVTIAYDATPDVRFGAMVQKAYNPGGTTIRIDTGRPDQFEAERLWGYELFARGSFAGGSGSASLNLFHNAMRDAQRSRDINVVTPGGRRAGFANLFNVPKAVSYGAEGALGWRLGDRLDVKAGIGLLRTKIVEADGESGHLLGNHFERSPPLTASVTVDWRPAHRLRLSAQARHHGPYFSDPENTPELRVGSGTSIDARAEYRIGRLALFAQARNVFDALNMRDFFTPTSGEAEDPRRIAIGLESAF